MDGRSGGCWLCCHQHQHQNIRHTVIFSCCSWFDAQRHFCVADNLTHWLWLLTLLPPTSTPAHQHQNIRNTVIFSCCRWFDTQWHFCVVVNLTHSDILALQLKLHMVIFSCCNWLYTQWYFCVAANLTPSDILTLQLMRLGLTDL